VDRNRKRQSVTRLFKDVMRTAYSIELETDLRECNAGRFAIDAT